MSRIIIAKDSASAKYAGTINAPTTANGALTPDLLASGAIGIYGIQIGATIAANQDKEVLIGDTTQTSVAGFVKATDFKGDLIKIVQGTPSGNQTATPDLSIVGISRVGGAKYVAPIFEVTYIGYNTVTGTGNLNIVTPIAQNAGASVLARQRTVVGSYRPEYPYSTGPFTPTSTSYNVVSAEANKINAGFNIIKGQSIIQFLAEVVTSGDGTRTAFTGNATVTNGSINVTVTAHILTAGTYVKFLGVTYLVATIIDANTFTLDRPYSGVTGTVLATDANSGSYTTTIATNIGLRITNLTLDSFDFTGLDILANASVSIQVGTLIGTGTPALIMAEENNEAPYRGDLNTYDAIQKHVPRFTDPTKTYNTYVMDCVKRNDTQNVEGVSSTRFNIFLAFAAEANTTGNNQANFENIISALVETNRGLAAGSVFSTGF